MLTDKHRAALRQLRYDAEALSRRLQDTRIEIELTPGPATVLRAAWAFEDAEADLVSALRDVVEELEQAGDRIMAALADADDALAQAAVTEADYAEEEADEAELVADMRRAA